ncbi:MAG: hypothetical protein V1905_03790 [bacterium]
MEEKELVEKLNSVSQINRESPSYRVRLRIALLTAHENIRESQKITGFAWKIIPVGALALMFLVLGLSREPSLSLKSINTISEAKQILQTDKQTKPLINDGAIIGDTQILGDRAYVLMQLPEKIASDPPIADKATIYDSAVNMESNYRQANYLPVGGGVYLVEIDLVDKKVIRMEEKIKQNETGLTEKDQRAVDGIISQRGQEMGLSENQIVSGIEVIRSQLKLIKKNGQFDLLPGSEQVKDVYLIYEQGGKQLKEKIETVPDK